MGFFFPCYSHPLFTPHNCHWEILAIGKKHVAEIAPDEGKTDDGSVGTL